VADEQVVPKGFHAVLKLNLPPVQQYHSGHSLIVQADSLGEIKELLAEEVGEDRASFIVSTFFENLLLNGVRDALTVPTTTAEEPTPSASGAASTTSTHGAPATKKPVSDDDFDPTPGQLKIAAKLGIDTAGLNKQTLAGLIKEAKSKEAK